MKKRVSKFELIRIIAMYLIVLHHSMVHGMLTMKPNQLLESPVNAAVGYIVASGGKIGVYLFVLITGYFMITSNISIKKLVKLWLPIFFWSVVLFIVFGCVINHEFSIGNLIKSIFPILFSQYWFMTVYVIMYLLIPLLNAGVNWVIENKKENYFYFISIVIILGNSEKILGGASQIGSLLTVFCVVYCLGAIFKKKDILKNYRVQKFSKILFISIILINFILIILLDLGYTYKRINFAFNLMKAIVLYPYTLFSIVEAILVFIIIGSSKMEYHPFINAISGTTFGIYLISDNRFIRTWLWDKTCHMNSLITTNPIIIVIYSLAITLIIFIICGGLEELRKFVFSNLENNIATKIENIVDK